MAPPSLDSPHVLGLPRCLSGGLAGTQPPQLPSRPRVTCTRTDGETSGGPGGEGVVLAGPFRALAVPRPDFSAGWGQQTAPWLCVLWRLFAISLPGLPAKCPLASRAARQVQLRILTTAACVPRISSRSGRPQSALPVSPVPQLPPLLGAWCIGSSQTQTQEWILVSSTF